MIKRILRSRGGGESVLSCAGLIYMMTNSRCCVLDPSSANFQLLSAPGTNSKMLPFLGKFLELKPGKDSLRILVGASHGNARPLELDEQLGAFPREVSR
jgi:hypothetical protein